MKTTNGGGNISPVEIIGNNVPTKFNLFQNYPNPFNPSTYIEFDVKNRSQIQLKVYNTLGIQIDVLVNEKLTAGTYKVEWNASNYSSGIYYYTLITEEYMETKKMVLIK